MIHTDIYLKGDKFFAEIRRNGRHIFISTPFDSQPELMEALEDLLSSDNIQNVSTHISFTMKNTSKSDEKKSV